MRRIGFLVNPFAGMGGSVGLKGTDGKVQEAVDRGAVPHARDRARSTLRHLAKESDLWFVTCSGEMGEAILEEAGVKNYEVLYHFHGESTADDTRNAARAFAAAGVDLILFCGGDGTARDVFDSVGTNVPVLGIPAGVKMYSSVFALDPGTAAEIMTGPKKLTFKDAEVMDVDEEAYRQGIFSTRLYGFVRVPCSEGKVQSSKHIFEDPDEGRAREEIARFMCEVMLPDTLYILGAGTTVEAIAHRAGVKKTLLGVDAIKNGSLVASDLSEREILALLEQEKDARIIVSPIGAQGFILGRGNQQISARVVNTVGIDHVIVVATPHKLRETPVLYVDTGDPDLDAGFGDSIQVISGYCIAQRRKIFRHAPGTMQL
jgi:predicted polyphosphate/ATP-dependent NAD kinase